VLLVVIVKNYDHNFFPNRQPMATIRIRATTIVITLVAENAGSSLMGTVFKMNIMA
jgi:hypothetical protein